MIKIIEIKKWSFVSNCSFFHSIIWVFIRFHRFQIKSTLSSRTVLIISDRAYIYIYIYMYIYIYIYELELHRHRVNGVRWVSVSYLCDHHHWLYLCCPNSLSLSHSLSLSLSLSLNIYIYIYIYIQFCLFVDDVLLM